MGNNLYDTGAPQKVVVVNPTAPDTRVARAQRVADESFDRLFRDLVTYLARHAAARERAERREATRDTGPVVEAEYEVIEVAPVRRQLAAPKPTRRKK